LSMSDRVDDPSFVTRASIFEWIRSTRAGEREMAWCDFRAKYAPIVGGFCRAMGASPQDIDDIIQDVMLGFFGVSEEFRYSPERGRFRGFLKVCTLRAAQRRAGKNLKHRGIPLEQLPADDLAIDHAWNDVWEQELLAAHWKRSAGRSVARSHFRLLSSMYCWIDRLMWSQANSAPV
jgi:DNA-directed RNA polymerase specialized sigma24 family protein